MNRGKSLLVVGVLGSVILGLFATVLLTGVFGIGTTGAGDSSPSVHLEKVSANGSDGEATVTAYENLSAEQRHEFDEALDGPYSDEELEIAEFSSGDHLIRYRGRLYEVSVSVA